MAQTRVEAGSVRVSVAIAVLATVAASSAAYVYSPRILAFCGLYTVAAINALAAGHAVDPREASTLAKALEDAGAADIPLNEYPSFVFVTFLFAMLSAVFSLSGLSDYIDASLNRTGTFFYFTAKTSGREGSGGSSKFPYLQVHGVASARSPSSASSNNDSAYESASSPGSTSYSAKGGEKNDIVVVPAHILAKFLPNALNSSAKKTAKSSSLERQSSVANLSDTELCKALIEAGVLVRGPNAEMTADGSSSIGGDSSKVNKSLVDSDYITTNSDLSDRLAVLDQESQRGISAVDGLKSSGTQNGHLQKVRLQGNNTGVYYLNIPVSDQKDFDSIFGLIKSPVKTNSMLNPFNSNLVSGADEESALTSGGNDDLSNIETVDYDKVILPPNNIYAKYFPELEAELLDICDFEKNPAGATESEGKPFVRLLTTSKEDGWIAEVDKKVGADNLFFRYTTILKCSPERAFDYLSDITNRPAWDPLCEEAQVIERFGGGCIVQYFRTRGMWPTKPRCTLVCGSSRRVADHTYTYVTRSIDEHPLYTPKSGDVRMQAELAGQYIRPDPAGREGYCQVIQVLRGNLGGWLPSSVVSLVTTQAIPKGLRKVFHILKTGENYTVSRVIAEAERDIESRKKEYISKRLSSKAGGGSATDSKYGTSIAPAGASSKTAGVDSASRVSDLDSIDESSTASKKGKELTKKKSGTVLLGENAFSRANILRVILKIINKTKPLLIVSVIIALVVGRLRRR